MAPTGSSEEHEQPASSSTSRVCTGAEAGAAASSGAGPTAKSSSETYPDAVASASTTASPPQHRVSLTTLAPAASSPITASSLKNRSSVGYVRFLVTLTLRDKQLSCSFFLLARLFLFMVHYSGFQNLLSRLFATYASTIKYILYSGTYYIQS